MGPPADPAELGTQTEIVEVFQRIAQTESTFISRGDESGTHMKETAIWRSAGVDPQDEWYVPAGAGMAAALRMASEMRGYTLSDRSTFLAQRESLDLSILFEGDQMLHNPYAVIVVSPEKHHDVNHHAAVQFSEFLLSREVQAVIDRFGVERFGEPLFFSRTSSSGSID